MGIDPTSFTTSACVKLLLVPLGSITESRFQSFVSRLQQHNVIRLGDVSPASRPNRSRFQAWPIQRQLLIQLSRAALFSPLAFPEGLIVYDLQITAPAINHSLLSPFELYRQPLVVAGILDGHDAGKETSNESSGKIDTETISSDYRGFLSSCLEQLSTDYPNSILHQVLLFDRDEGIEGFDDGVLSVPTPQRSRSTTIKTVMCDLSSRLLAEMTSFAKIIQNFSSVRTPTTLDTFSTLSEVLSAIPAHMNGNSRPTSISDRPRSFSPRREDVRANRMSLPVNLASNRTSRSRTPDSRAASPPSAIRTPPLVLDDASSNHNISSPGEPSQDRSRPESRDPAAQQYESSNLVERERIKHKGRIGVIIGSMYLMAGQWPDAAKELVQSTNAARANSDYVWQAKALDHLLVCFFMCAWAGMDFHVSYL